MQEEEKENLSQQFVSEQSKIQNFQKNSDLSKLEKGILIYYGILFPAIFYAGFGLIAGIESIELLYEKIFSVIFSVPLFFPLDMILAPLVFPFMLFPSLGIFFIIFFGYKFFTKKKWIFLLTTIVWIICTLFEFYINYLSEETIDIIRIDFIFLVPILLPATIFSLFKLIKNK